MPPFPQPTARNAGIRRRERTWSDSDPLPTCYSNHWTPGFSRTRCCSGDDSQSFSKSIPLVSSSRYIVTSSSRRNSHRHILWNKHIHPYLISSSVSFSKRNHTWPLLFSYQWRYDHGKLHHRTRTWLGISDVSKKGRIAHHGAGVDRCWYHARKSSLPWTSKTIPLVTYALLMLWFRLGWDSCLFSLFCWHQVVQDADGQFNDKLPSPVLWYYNLSVKLFPLHNFYGF